MFVLCTLARTLYFITLLGVHNCTWVVISQHHGGCKLCWWCQRVIYWRYTMLSFNQCLSTVVQSATRRYHLTFQTYLRVYTNAHLKSYIQIYAIWKHCLFQAVLSSANVVLIYVVKYLVRSALPIEVVFIIAHYVIIMNYPYISIELNCLNEVFSQWCVKGLHIVHSSLASLSNVHFNSF